MSRNDPEYAENGYGEKMKKRYLAMAHAETAFTWELAHAFGGEGSVCTTCGREPDYRHHACPQCVAEVFLDSDGVCPVCDASAGPMYQAGE